MFATCIDRFFGVCVWYFCGATNTDEDYERYIESIGRADEMAAKIPFPPAAILFVEAENPMPGAKWRKRFAEASMALKSRPFVAFASPAPMVRGVVTAVNWFRPPPFEFEVVASFEAGVAWLETKRGASLPRLYELLAQCREDVKGPPASRTGARPVGTKRA